MATDPTSAAATPGPDHSAGDSPARDADLLAATADQLFFIVGCGRSGTTLLQSMISAHPRAVMPGETKFYTVIRRRSPHRAAIEQESAYRAEIDRILSLWWIKELSLAEPRFRGLCAAGPRSFETILLALLATFREMHDAGRVGEKSPGHVGHLGHLSRAFPRARFVHMIRDPRAVVLSQVRAQFATPYVGSKIAKWRAAADQHFRFEAALGPSRYCMMRYEDLVRDTEGQLRRVCDFLGLDFDPRMLAHEQRGVRGFADRQMGHMANTLKPVFTSSIEKWRQELPPRHIALVEHALAGPMARLGYDPTGARVSAPALRLAASNAADAAARARRRLFGKPLAREDGA